MDVVQLMPSARCEPISGPMSRRRSRCWEGKGGILGLVCLRLNYLNQIAVVINS